MKNSNATKKKDMIFFVTVLASFILPTLFSSNVSASENYVTKAYQLRMNGQADSAKTLLERNLAMDSTDAAAWFELARTKHHLGLGNPRKLFAGLEDLQNCISKAVQLEPDNVIYGFYNGSIHFLLAYASMMRHQPDAKQKLEATFTAYESLLKIKSDYKEAMLYLVEALTAPKDMGGNFAEAQQYAEKLEKLDPVFGAKAKELVLPEDADRIQFWENALAENKGNADITEQLGKACLYQGKIEEGEQYLDKAIQIDPGKSILLMDMARFYLMQSRRDTALAKSALPKADKKIDRFLGTNPIRPIRAFALNMQAGIKQMQGFSNEAKTLQTEANKLDPNVSKAFAVPGEILFSEPDEVSNYHSYFFRPF